MVVFQRADSIEYRAIAEEIADERGEAVVADCTVMDDDEVVVYVDPPTEISEQALFTLLSRPNDVETGGVSVVTGRTPQAARSLWKEPEVVDGPHSLLVRMANTSITVDDSDAVVLDGEDATADQLRAVSSEDPASFSFLSNAEDIHAYLKDGLICGFPAEPETFDFDGVQPPCVVDGQRDCTLDGEVLLAEDFAAPFMFLNGCTSPLANNHVELPINLGLAFLTEAASVIAPFRIISVNRFQVALHYALLRAGYSAVERVSVLNQSATHANVDSHPYVAFGRPENAIRPSTEQSFDIEYAPTDDGYRIDATAVDAHVLDFTVPAEHVEGEEPFFLRTTDDHDRDVFYTAFREDDQIRVVVYTWGRLSTNRISFELAASSVLDDAPFVSHLGDADARVDIGLISGKARGQLKNARNTIAGAAKYREREPYLATAHETIRERIRQAESSLSNAQESLLEELRDRQTYLLQEEYEDKTYPEGLSWNAGDCPYCDRDVYVTTLTDTYRRVRRSVGLCPRCSFIFDAPQRDDFEYPTLEGDIAPIAYGKTADVDLCFENPRDEPMEVVGTISPSVYREEVFAPERRRVELSPNASVSMTFEVDTTDLEPKLHNGTYWLEGHVVTDDLQVYTGMRTLYLYED